MNNLQENDKVQKISQYLKANVIEPAEVEARKILDDAGAEKTKIVEQAKQEAKKIIDEAEEKVKQLHQSSESAIRLSAKQAVNSLKIAIENELLNAALNEQLSNSINDPNVIKDILVEMSKAYMENNFTGEFAILLSEQNKETLKDFVKEQVQSNIKSDVVLSDDTVPGGCKIVLKDEKVEFDITEKAVSELLLKFLRPELRTYLFQ